MWYHRVSQRGCDCVLRDQTFSLVMLSAVVVLIRLTVAVNYWHDMEFDCKYVYNHMLTHVSKLLPTE
jgi:hypothetical protein